MSEKNFVFVWMLLGEVLPVQLKVFCTNKDQRNGVFSAFLPSSDVKKGRLSYITLEGPV